MVSKAQLIAMEFMNSASFAYLFTGINTLVLGLYKEASYTRWDDSPLVVSLVTLAFVLGQTLSCFAVPIARKYWTVKGASIFFCINLIVSIAAVFIPVHWAYLMVFRFWQGICQMSGTTLNNEWIALYDPSVNKFYSPFISTNIMINYALMFMTNDDPKLWSLSQLYGLVTAIVLFGLILATPLKESNRSWDHIVQMSEQGEQTEDVKQVKEHEYANKKDWYKLVPKKDLMMVQIFLGISSQITGISNAVNFATAIFDDVFYMMTPFQSSIVGAIIMGFCKAVSSFLCILVTKKARVAVTYGVGLGVTVIANVIQAVSFVYSSKGDKPDENVYMVLVLVSAILFICAFELSAGCLQFYINGVVASFGNPTMLGSLMFGCWSTTNIIVCFTYKFFEDFYWVIYMIYAILTVITTAIMLYYIVKNKPLVAALDRHD